MNTDTGVVHVRPDEMDDDTWNRHVQDEKLVPLPATAPRSAQPTPSRGHLLATEASTSRSPRRRRSVVAADGAGRVLTLTV